MTGTNICKISEKPMSHEQTITRALGQYWIFWWCLQPSLLLKTASKTGKYASDIWLEPPRKLLSDWCYKCKHPLGAPAKSTHKTHLEFLKKSQIWWRIGSNSWEQLWELSCIFALTSGDNIEFNLHAGHVFHDLVKAWPLNSTVSTSVNECWLNRISPLMDINQSSSSSMICAVEPTP